MEPLTNQAAFTQISIKSPERLSQPTEAGPEPQHEHEQLPQTNNQFDKIQELDDELEEIELRLRRNELLKRRRGLVQESQLPQQAQRSERPGLQYSQEDITASDGVASVASPGEKLNDVSQGILSVSTVYRMA